MTFLRFYRKPIPMIKESILHLHVESTTLDERTNLAKINFKRKQIKCKTNGPKWLVCTFNALAKRVFHPPILVAHIINQQAYIPLRYNYSPFFFICFFFPNIFWKWSHNELLWDMRFPLSIWWANKGKENICIFFHLILLFLLLFFYKRSLCSLLMTMFATHYSEWLEEQCCFLLLLKREQPISGSGFSELTPTRTVL